ncbi:MAG: putative 2-dehydropantoate 2-reductase [Salinivirgaceae bacterium]|nr:putative 2-dehydropantoate 2-reductase [Salinivirgaceae bacterium]
MNLRYAIVGSGAIGGYYGGRLANSGCDVHFLFNTEYEHVTQNGLRVDSVKGDFVINPINAYHSTANMPKCDVVLVGLKTTQNHLLPQILPPLLKPDTLVVLIQNGLGLEAKLASALPHQPIAGAAAFICSSRVGKGHICHADYGAITIGMYNGDCQDVIAQMKVDFEQANVPFSIATDLNETRWRKLVWNIPYNGLTVALNTSTDRLMNTPATRALVTDLMNEVVDAAAVCNAVIEREFVEKMLTMTDRMTPYSPSMKLDFDNHRPMEIEAIYSNPVKTALAAGYHMRKTEMLEQELRFIASKQ